MQLKDLLSLRPISDLKQGIEIYNLKLNSELKKKDLIEILNDYILNEDNIILTLIRLNTKEIMLLNKEYTFINVNNAPNILNLDAFLLGLRDENKYYIAKDFSNKALKLYEENKDIITKFQNLNMSIVFCVNFYGIFDFYDIYNIYSKLQKLDVREFSILLANFNKIIKYYEISNDKYKALNLGEKELENNDFYIPTKDEIIEYYIKNYLISDTLKEFKRMASQNHDILDTELFTRYIYDTANKDEEEQALTLLQNYFKPTNNKEIEVISEAYVLLNMTTRKIKLRGLRKIDLKKKSNKEKYEHTSS